MIPKDFILEIAKQQVPGHLGLAKFGVHPGINTADGTEPIWDGGAPYAFPTESQAHTILSTSIEDSGTIISQGTSTKKSITYLIDENGTFLTDVVSPGDLVTNDTGIEHATVAKVHSQTHLTLFKMRCIRLGQTPVCKGFSIGDNYRVLRTFNDGAGVVFVQGLNETFSEVSGYMVVAGIIPITRPLKFSRIFRMEVLSSGSAKANVGDISLNGNIDGTDTAIIKAGNNQTLMAIFTVPRGITAFLTSWWAGIANKQAAVVTAKIKWGEVGRALRVREPIVINSQGSSQHQRFLEVPDVITEMNDIVVEGSSDSNGVAITGGFDLILIANSVLEEGVVPV